MKLRSQLLNNTLALAFTFSYTASSVTAEPVVTGSVTKQRVQQLTNEISWYRSLKEAKEVAQQEGKMIFWVHMLGRMDGGT